MKLIDEYKNEDLIILYWWVKHRYCLIRCMLSLCECENKRCENQMWHNWEWQGRKDFLNFKK